MVVITDRLVSANVAMVKKNEMTVLANVTGNFPFSQPISNSGAQRVIDVVDLVKTSTTPALLQNPVVVSLNQVRTVLNSQAVTLSSSLVTNNNSMTTTMTGPPVMKRFVYTTQQPILATRNGMGPFIVNAPQVVLIKKT